MWGLLNFLLKTKLYAYRGYWSVWVPYCFHADPWKVLPMNISTWEPGTALQSLGTLDMPNSILNILQHIWQCFTNGSMRLVQSMYKIKIYVSNTHFWTSLRKSSKIPICICHFKTRREWSMWYYRNTLCPQGFFFFLDKFLKDKASRRMTVLDQRKDTRSPRCQEWRHQYYVLFHEHNIPWFIPSSVISTLLELNNKGFFWMSFDLASLIWDIHCFVFRGVQLYKMANSHQIRH